MEKRVGIVGMGFIGGYIYRRIVEDPSLGLEIAFAWNRTPDRRGGVPPELVLEELDDFGEMEPDLIVEAAHPDVTRRFGERFLHEADYLMTSVSALADDGLHERLLSAAQNNRKHLFVPHGALVGADSLWEQRESWSEVTITFRKHPDNLDFSESGVDPASIDGETVVYDGPVRGIANKFPRNVNTMVTCGLLSLGLDKTRGVLVADPSLKELIAEIEAVGKDGSRVVTRKAYPGEGVSGTDMQDSILNSVLTAAGQPPGIVFV